MTRTCTDICKACKRAAPCTQMTGVGELCAACQPSYTGVSDLIDVLDSLRRDQTDEVTWRAGIRCLQRLDINYQIVNGRLNIGASLGRLTTLRQAAEIEQEAIAEVLRSHERRVREHQRSASRRAPLVTSSTSVIAPV